MKDFDLDLALVSEDDRTFNLRGTKFTFKPRVAAEDLARYEDARFNPEKSSLDVLEEADKLVSTCLNGQQADWTKLRKEGDPPLSFQDINGVIEHMLEVTSRRPIEPSGVSGATRSPGGTTSKEKSS